MAGTSFTKRLLSLARVGLSLAKLVGLLAALAVLMVAAVLVWVLGSSQGLAVTVDAGLGFYNEMIPGSITVSRVEGPLFRQLHLHGIRIQDAQGRDLVTAKELELSWNLFSIVDKDLRVQRLGLSDAVVTLFEHEGTSGFVDLAPVSKGPPEPEPLPEPEEPSTGILPTLPFAITLDELRLRGVTLRPAPAPDAKEILNGLVLDAAARWDENGLVLSRFETRSKVPLVPVDVQGLSFTASLAGYDLAIPGLDLRTDMGRVKLADTRINLDTLRVEASVTASVPPAVVAKQAGVTLPGAVELTLKAKGTPEQMEADVRVRIGTAALHLKASGGALPAPQGTASLTLENVNPKDFAIPLAGSLNLALAASGQGDSLATAQADVTLTCRDCTLEAYGPVALDLQASLKEQQAKVNLQAAILGLTLQLAAQSPDLKTMTANLTASLPSLEAVVSALALPPMQAAVDLTSRCEGPFTAPRCTADLSLSNVAVNDIHLERANLEASNDWQGETPTFETSLRVPSIALPGLTVRGVGLNVTGTPSKQEITLSVFHDERNQGRVALSLEPAGPRIHWSQGEGLLGGVSLGLVQAVDVAVQGKTVTLSPLELRIQDGRLRVEGLIDPEGSNDVTLLAENLDLALLRKIVAEPALAGRLSLESSLRGSLGDPSITLDLNAQALQVGGAQLGNLSVNLQARDKRTEAEILLVRDSLRLAWLKAALPLWLSSQAGNEPFDKTKPSEVHVTLHKDLLTVLEPLLPMPDGLTARLGLEAHVQGTVETFTAETRVVGDLQPAKQAPALPLELSLTANEHHQALSVVVTENPLGRVDLQTAFDVNVPNLVHGAPFEPQSLVLNTTLVLHGLDLDALNPLLPEAIEDLTGNVEGDLRVSGTVARPDLSGSLTLSKGGVTVVPIHQRLSELQATVKAEGRLIRLDAFSAKLGTGSIEAKGAVALSDNLQPDADITVTLDELPLEFPGAPPGKLDSEIRIQFRQDEQGTRGDIDLKKTMLQLYSLKTKAPKDIPGNSNIVFVGEGTEAPLPKPDLPPSVFTVRFSDPLVLFGPMLDMAWQGTIQAETKNAETSITGGLTLQRGDFDFLGNRFTTDQATVAFPPGTNNTPFLNFVASTDTSEAKVTLILRGPAQAPELSFRSEPPMPQYQIFTLLVTGTTETNDESSDQVQGKAANLGSGLIAMQFPELQQQLSTRLGIDRVGVSFGETTEEPILHVGKRLTRRLYLQTNFHSNAPEDVNTTELMMQLMLTPQWNLETFYGDASVGGLDVFWHRSFGGTTPTPTQAPVKTPQAEPTASQAQSQDEGKESPQSRETP